MIFVAEPDTLLLLGVFRCLDAKYLLKTETERNRGNERERQQSTGNYIFKLITQNSQVQILPPQPLICKF